MTYLINNKVCVPKKVEDLNLSVFNMIWGINESKTLTKHISCECKSRFDGRKCNSDQWRNNRKCWYKCEKRHVCEKYYIWNPGICRCKNRKYLESIMDDSAITCDEIIESYDEEAKAISTNFSETKQPVKRKICIFYFINLYSIIDRIINDALREVLY